MAVRINTLTVAVTVGPAPNMVIGGIKKIKIIQSRIKVIKEIMLVNLAISNLNLKDMMIKKKNLTKMKTRIM